MKKIIPLNAIAVIITALTYSSCEGVRDDFSDMFKLRDSLKQIYPDEDIHVNVSNGFFINISFVNSDLKKLSKKEKEQIAEKAGKITDHFFNDNGISEGSLTFVIRKNYIVFKYTEAIDSYDLKLSAGDTIEEKENVF